MTGNVLARGVGVLLGAGVLLTGGAPVVLSAQEPDPTITETAAALLELEAEVVEERWVAEGWQRHRSGWASRVEAATTPRDFARLLAELESAITWHAVHDCWRSRRPAWRARARSASTVADLRMLYVELWAALIKQWDICEGRWCP